MQAYVPVSGSGAGYSAIFDCGGLGREANRAGTAPDMARMLDWATMTKKFSFVD